MRTAAPGRIPHYPGGLHVHISEQYIQYCSLFCNPYSSGNILPWMICCPWTQTMWNRARVPTWEEAGRSSRGQGKMAQPTPRAAQQWFVQTAAPWAA